MDIQNHARAAVLLSSLVIVACGPDNKSSNNTSNPTADPIVISGEIRNLGGSLTVSLDGEYEETFSAGWYSFEEEVPKGTEYALLITAQPDGQFCSFDGPEFGVIEDEFNLNIDCVDNLKVTVNEGVQGNGSPSRISQYEINSLELPASFEYDSNADGVAEYDYKKLYNSTGQTIEHSNSDGRLEVSRFDSEDRKISHWIDNEGDGYIDSYSKYVHLPGGESNHPAERYDDRDNDGSWDYIEKRFDTKCGLLYSQDRNGNGVIEFNLGDRETSVGCSTTGGVETRHRWQDGLIDYTEREFSTVNGDGSTTVTTEVFFDREPDPTPDTVKSIQTSSTGKELLEQRRTTYNHPSGDLYVTYEFRSNYNANDRLESTRRMSWTYGRQPSLIYKYYNSAGQLVRDVRRAQDNLPITAETIFTYNAQGLLSTSTREIATEISVTTYTYYASGRKRSQVTEVDTDKNGSMDFTINYQEFANFDAPDEPGYPASAFYWYDSNRDGIREVDITNTYENQQLKSRTSRYYNDDGEITGTISTVYTFNSTGHVTKIEQFENDTVRSLTTIQYEGNLSIPFNLDALDS